MDILTRQRALTNVIKAFTSSVKETPQDQWTLGLVRVRQELLENYWGNFQTNHLALLDLPDAEPEEEREMISFMAIERICTDAREILDNVQLRLDAAAARACDAEMRSTAPSYFGVRRDRLPHITIPVFSGKRIEWEPFRDLFRALIHNNESLSDVERLYYLKTHVEGDVKISLDKLQVVGSNYAIAWGLLERRFQHRRLLVEDHLTAMLKLKQLDKETAAGLQFLLDSLEGHRDQLHALKRPVDHWDDWFVAIASRCMDPITRRLWEDEMQKLGRSEDGQNELMATFSNLTNFLRKRCRVLESAEASQRPTA